MKAVSEPLEGNTVKLSVEVDAKEFEKALDAAFKKIAHDIRVPGFRPGKAPRRLIEARIGPEAARQEALRDALPEYYAQALKETATDAIAPPEIDITSGEDGGPVVFDAVVEVRPQVSVPGYGGLQVTLPNPSATDDDVDRQVDRLRNNFAELTDVDRPAQNGDHVTIDLSGSRDGADVEGLNATDFLYELGSGTVLPELDDQLPGTKVGDILEFTAAIPGQDDATLKVLVKAVKEKVLPEVTDEWAADASEFETVAELRDSLRERIGAVKRIQTQMALREQVLVALAELVVEEAPEALVGAEMESRIHDIAHRLQAQGADIGQYLAATDQTQEDFVASLREEATRAVKIDLGLRAVADAEVVEVADADIEAEIARLAEQSGQKAPQLRRQLERNDQMPAVRSSLRKAKALEWLLEHAEVVDEEGHPIDRADLTPEVPEDEPGTEGTES